MHAHESSGLHVLLDQNVPKPVVFWIRSKRSDWFVVHTSDLGLNAKPDVEIFAYAQERGFLIITFDEDFADQRRFPVGQHHGVVRLRIWPTTIEETQAALARLLAQV